MASITKGECSNKGKKRSRTKGRHDFCAGCSQPMYDSTIGYSSSSNSNNSSSSSRDVKHIIVYCSGDGGCEDTTNGCTNRFHLSCANIPPSCSLYRSILSDHCESQNEDQGQSNACTAMSRSSSTDSLGLVDDTNDSIMGGVGGSSNGNNKARSRKRKKSLKTRGFLCPSCDVEGTSRYLMEYMEDFRSIKKEFYQDQITGECMDRVTGSDFITHLVQLASSTTKKGSSSSIPILKQTEVGLPKLQTMLQRIARSHETDRKTEKSEDGDTSSASGDKREFGGVIANAILASEPNNKNKNDGSDGQTEDTTERFSSEDDDFVSCYSSEASIQSSPVEEVTTEPLAFFQGVNPQYFVGQPLRLYCHVDNSYHVGRIVDWRAREGIVQTKAQYITSLQKMGQASASSTSSSRSTSRISRGRQSDSQQLGLDPDIASVQYLVRFRHGVGGRKIALHHWLFLEEHPLSVGAGLIWVKVDTQNRAIINAQTKDPNRLSTTTATEEKHDASSCVFRPAQIMVRTALEMVPVRAIQTNTSLSNGHTQTNGGSSNIIHVMALFFAQAFRHAVLQLGGGLTHCPSMDDVIVADFLDPPKCMEKSLKRVRPHDRGLTIAVASACMEREEQRRIRAWHNISPFPLEYTTNAAPVVTNSKSPKHARKSCRGASNEFMDSNSR